MCSLLVSISGLLANEGDMIVTKLQCPIGFQGHHAILCNQNRYIFFLEFSGITEQFCIMSSCPWVQGKSDKIPPPEVCLWGRGIAIP